MKMSVHIDLKNLSFLFLLLVSVIGCKGKNEKANAYFNATVLETDGQSVLAEPFEGAAERKSADKISVSIEAISTHKVPPMEAGTKIRIVYDGNIAESYPAQINNTVAIYLIDESKNGI